MAKKTPNLSVVEPPKRPKPKHKPARKPNGQFLPGNTGNPAGRPRQLIKWAREHVVKILKEEGPDGDAFRVMGEIINGAYGAKPQDRIMAFRELCNRALGKPLNYIELTGADEEPLNPPSQVDVTKLSDKELSQLYGLMAKASKDK